MNTHETRRELDGWFGLTLRITRCTCGAEMCSTVHAVAGHPDRDIWTVVAMASEAEEEDLIDGIVHEIGESEEAAMSACRMVELVGGRWDDLDSERSVAQLEAGMEMPGWMARELLAQTPEQLRKLRALVTGDGDVVDALYGIHQYRTSVDRRPRVMP